ncbi:hypothetical protein WMY93_002905 [Mugilogobius chulae]|uniref:Uncharacterized protein n=1 Tax=Mugilogobius chulae TaxID=88201 RepID=A0AAW0PXW1_9GOBI
MQTETGLGGGRPPRDVPPWPGRLLEIQSPNYLRMTDGPRDVIGLALQKRRVIFGDFGSLVTRFVYDLTNTEAFSLADLDETSGSGSNSAQKRRTVRGQSVLHLND